MAKIRSLCYNFILIKYNLFINNNFLKAINSYFKYSVQFNFIIKYK